MTYHELCYVRFLIRTIKDLYIEKEAMAVLLDTEKPVSGRSSPDQWRSRVRSMQTDPVYRSAVEANFQPRFDRFEQALQDESLLKTLKETIE